MFNNFVKSKIFSCILFPFIQILKLMLLINSFSLYFTIYLTKMFNFCYLFISTKDKEEYVCLYATRIKNLNFSVCGRNNFELSFPFINRKHVNTATEEISEALVNNIISCKSFHLTDKIKYMLLINSLSLRIF